MQGKCSKTIRKRAEAMYKGSRKEQTELDFEDFFLPFGGKLRSNNRWVMMSKIIPWDFAEEEYSRHFGDTGNPAKNFRVALGSLIIKERLGLTDEETVLQIQENPYLQYFIGYNAYRDEKPFDSSLMVHFRKRINLDFVQKMNEKICGSLTSGKSASDLSNETRNNSDEDDDDESPPSGKLLIDATCAPEDMRYPTDVSLLNESRELTEKVIDVLWDSSTQPDKGLKPRTYRKKARKCFVGYTKQRRPSSRIVQKTIGKQLGFIKRNLGHITAMTENGYSLSVLDRHLYKKLLVVSEVYRQQCEHRKVYRETGRHRVADRIVSISKPHVRPIIRGKASAAVEFGAKISVSVIDGKVFLDRLDWNAYNECNDLVEQAEAYRRRTGRYPESILADRLYQTRENKRWCNEKGIRLSGAKLGRPFKNPDENTAILKQRYQDDVDRIEIEGKFGVAKRRYGMNRLMTKLRETSEMSIAMTFLVMNLMKVLLSPFFLSIKRVKNGVSNLLWLVKHHLNYPGQVFVAGI